jgi:hypothetical protein
MSSRQIWKQEDASRKERLYQEQSGSKEEREREKQRNKVKNECDRERNENKKAKEQRVWDLNGEFVEPINTERYG